MSRVIDKLLTEDGTVWGWAFHCPGCEGSHVFYMAHAGHSRPAWSFDGNEASPTFSPSLLNTWKEGPEQTPKCCHLFVRAGRIEFLGDCTHAFAGKTVPLEPIDPPPETTTP